jgi:hypothetical protein
MYSIGSGHDPIVGTSSAIKRDDILEQLRSSALWN